jgi:hypothetical protein
VFYGLLPGRWTHYLNSVSAAELTRILSSVMFLELRDYYVNTVRLHVTAADALVRRGVDRTTSDNRRLSYPFNRSAPPRRLTFALVGDPKTPSAQLTLACR